MTYTYDYACLPSILVCLWCTVAQKQVKIVGLSLENLLCWLSLWLGLKATVEASVLKIDKSSPSPLCWFAQLSSRSSSLATSGLASRDFSCWSSPYASTCASALPSNVASLPSLLPSDSPWYRHVYSWSSSSSSSSASPSQSQSTPISSSSLTCTSRHG